MLAFTRTLLASTALLLSTNALAADDYVILELGDRQIKQSEVETIWEGLFPQGAAPDFETVEEPVRQNVLRGVVSEYLLYDEALAANVEKDPQLQRQLDEAKRKLIVRHYIEQKSAGMVSETDIRRAYDELLRKTAKQQEARARHILVDSEDRARELKAELDKGGDFEALAKEHSQDPGSKPQGGDLGYFTKEKMVPEFAEAAFALDEGAVSDPVKTGFGWHLIKVEDKRPVQPPKFAEVKEELRSQLVEEKLNDYVNRMVDQTDIVYFGPDGAKRDLSKTPDSNADKQANAR